MSEYAAHIRDGLDGASLADARALVRSLPVGDIQARDNMARLVWPVPGTPNEVQLRYGEVWWGQRCWRLHDGEDPTALALALLAATAEARRQVCDE